MKIPLKLNTITNYLGLFVRMAEGILVVRWMVGLMGQSLYGLWGTLWSFFAYAILVDFGFGFTAEKYTANDLPRTDPTRYNAIISTVFAFHLMMAVVLIAVVYGVSFFTNDLFHLQSATLAEQHLGHLAFLCFGIGTACIFPTTMFKGILTGLQRLYVCNILNALSKIVEFIGVLVIFYLQKYVVRQTAISFIILLVFILGLMFVTNVIQWFMVKRYLPRANFFKGFNREAFQTIFSFSGFVYLNSIMRLLVNTISGVLVGSCEGLYAAGTYQIAKRFPLLASQLTSPYQENTSPLTARLYARAKLKVLGSVLVGFMRWNSLISSGLFALLYVLTPNLIVFFFKVENPLAEAICRAMLVAGWLNLSLRTVPLAAMMMANRHKMVTLVYTLNAIGVTGGTVIVLKLLQLSLVWVPIVGCIANMAVFFCLLFPCMLSTVHLSPWPVLYRVIVQPLFATALLVVAVYGVQGCCAALGNFMVLAIGGSVGTVAYGIGLWGLVLTPAERALIMGWLPKKWQRG